MIVQLALRKDDSRLSARLIQWWTASPYSHCELVVDGWCYSSSVMDKGVRRKRIDLKPDKWDLIDLPWASAADVVHYFAATDHYRYGWPSLITSQLFNLNRPVKGAEFCSEWCAKAVRLPNAASYSPASLGDLCRWIAQNPAASH